MFEEIFYFPLFFVARKSLTQPSGILGRYGESVTFHKDGGGVQEE